MDLQAETMEDQAALEHREMERMKEGVDAAVAAAVAEAVKNERARAEVIRKREVGMMQDLLNEEKKEYKASEKVFSERELRVGADMKAAVARATAAEQATQQEAEKLQQSEACCAAVASDLESVRRDRAALEDSVKRLQAELRVANEATRKESQRIEDIERGHQAAAAAAATAVAEAAEMERERTRGLFSNSPLLRRRSSSSRSNLQNLPRRIASTRTVATTRAAATRGTLSTRALERRKYDAGRSAAPSAGLSDRTERFIEMLEQRTKTLIGDRQVVQGVMAAETNNTTTSAAAVIQDATTPSPPHGPSVKAAIHADLRRRGGELALHGKTQPPPPRKATINARVKRSGSIVISISDDGRGGKKDGVEEEEHEEEHEEEQEEEQEEDAAVAVAAAAAAANNMMTPQKLPDKFTFIPWNDDNSSTEVRSAGSKRKELMARLEKIDHRSHRSKTEL